MSLPSKAEFLANLVRNPFLSGDTDCPVCYESVQSPVITARHHIFCITCLRTWLDLSNTCPTCRHHLYENTPATSIRDALTRNNHALLHALVELAYHAFCQMCEDHATAGEVKDMVEEEVMKLAIEHDVAFDDLLAAMARLIGEFLDRAEEEAGQSGEVSEVRNEEEDG